MPAYTSTRYTYEGTETTETTIVRVGGATDPAGQTQSRKIVTTANAQWLRPFKAEPYAVWNATTGANVTATIYGTVNSDVMPTNDEIFAEFEFLGSGSSTLGSIVTTTKANLLATGTAVASDASTWSVSAITSSYDGTVSSGIVLSNGNCTVQHGTTAVNVGAMSAAFLNTGKYYFEVTIQSMTVSTNAIGIIRSNGTFADPGANSGANCVMVYGTGFAFVDGANVGTLGGGGWAVGAIYSFAIDFNARLAWIRRQPSGNWNNSGTANPATGAGGFTFPSGVFSPFVSFGSASPATDTLSGNFGASAFAYTPPSGFGNWYGWTPFKLTTTLSAPQPGQAGYIHARVRAGKASAAYYIDPQIILS